MNESVGLLPWAVGGILIVAGASRLWPRHRTLYAGFVVALLLGAALVPGPRLWVRIALGALALGVAAAALGRRKAPAR